MKLLIFCLSFLLSVGSVAAQEIQYSPYETFDIRSGDFAVVGRVGGRIYAYQSTVSAAYLHAYDDSMQRIATVVLDFFPEKLGPVRFVTYTDKIAVLYETTEGRTTELRGALLDADGRLLGDPKKLMTVRADNRTELATAVSDDRRTIIAYTLTEDGDELEAEAIWLDETLATTGRGRARFTADDDPEPGAGVVSNAGDLYLPITTSAGLKGYADNFWVARLRRDAKTFEREAFRLNGLYAASPFLKVDNAAGRVYVSGFYSAKKNGNFDGVLYGFVDATSYTLQNRRTIAFDDRIREASGVRSRRRAFNTYDVRQLIIKNDGGFVMVSEANYISTRQGYTPGWGYYSFYWGPMMAPSVREYHYDDILALSYDGDGNKEWHAFIRKDQYSQEDGGIFSSYALLNNGASLGFLFNDFNRTHSSIQLATVDETGGVDVRSFAPGGPGEPDWLPRSAKQVSAREVVVPCLRRRGLCFAKVVL